VAVFTVAATRPWRTAALVAALAFAPLPILLWRLAELREDRADSALTYFALIAGAIGWGLFRRSRQQLIASLRERAELAEADAELRAERARQEVREEIAWEMHDVLGHRLSLLTVHAGALEFNMDAPREEIARAAGVIRQSAHLALRDLAEVIGVFRAESAEGERPQPELSDLVQLVAEARATGSRVELTGPPDASPPSVVGRTAYRIVQEALTNARKHAPGAAVAVRVTGSPAHRLTVEVHNALPAGPTPDAGLGEGSGQGLIGLAERARLAGGELSAGPADGGFQVCVWLPWPAADTASAAHHG
jgi:signal transduction histidine kinase